MATMDAGGGRGGRKSVNHEIPLIPFIDFLLCLVSFLLITAVWSQMARIDADARVPGPPSASEPEERSDRTLHVEMKGDRHFQLVWKDRTRVLNTLDVPRKAALVGDSEEAYPELAEKIASEWARNDFRHFAPTDPQLDQAVLHTDNSTPFKDVVAVIDAIYSAKRDYKTPSGEVKRRAAFNVTFSIN